MYLNIKAFKSCSFSQSAKDWVRFLHFWQSEYIVKRDTPIHHPASLILTLPQYGQGGELMGMNTYFRKNLDLYANVVKVADALHFNQMQYTALHCTALLCIALHCNVAHCTALHCCTALSRCGACLV